ncbi:hypothetical protein AAY473_037766, partial [Plecturocebus cupreus]
MGAKPAIQVLLRTYCEQITSGNGFAPEHCQLGSRFDLYECGDGAEVPASNDREWSRVLLCGPGWSAVAQTSLDLLSSSNPPASISQAARTTVHAATPGYLFIIVEAGSCHVAQAGLELLGLSNYFALASQDAGIPGMNHRVQPACDPPTLASQSTEITGVSHCAQSGQLLSRVGKTEKRDRENQYHAFASSFCLEHK